MAVRRFCMCFDRRDEAADGDDKIPSQIHKPNITETPQTIGKTKHDSSAQKNQEEGVEIKSQSAYANDNHDPNQLSTKRSAEFVRSVTSTSLPIATRSSEDTPSAASVATSLWGEALTQLNTEKQALIRKCHEAQTAPERYSTKSGLIDSVHDAAVEQRDQYKASGAKFTFHGKEIILSDVAEKVIGWVNTFKNIGDIASSFNPHASLAWSVVKLFIEPIAANQEQHAALLLAVDRTGYLIDRTRVYELLYLQGDLEEHSQVFKNIKASLLALYVYIMNVSATVKQVYDKNAASRTMHAILNPGEIKAFLEQSQQLEDRVAIDANNCESELNRSGRAKQSAESTKLKELLEDLKQPIMRIDDRVTKVLKHIEEDERNEALTFVSTIPYEDDHNRKARKRTQDTCQWLLRHQTYIEWRNSSASDILWLHGNPGTGKSTLTSMVVDTLLQRSSEKQSDEAIAYFYCNRDAPDHRDPPTIFRSLIRQLSMSNKERKAVHPTLWDLYCRRKDTNFSQKEISMEEIQRFVLELTSTFPQTNIIIDALDESNDSSRAELIDVLENVVREAPNLVKLFISSRDNDDIGFRFKDTLEVNVTPKDNDRDIQAFLEDQIATNNKHRRKPLPSDLMDKIVREILLMSHGMFQYAALQINPQFGVLAYERNADIIEQLSRLPNGLEQTYEVIYKEINAQPGGKSKIAWRALQWVVHARVPLAEELLNAAVCQDPTAETEWDIDVDAVMIHDYCRNLLVLDKSSKKWGFSHNSARDYAEKHETSPSDAQAAIAAVCLSTLTDPKIMGNVEWRAASWRQQIDWGKMTAEDARQNKDPPDVDIWASAWEVSETDVRHAITTPMYALIALRRYAAIFWPIHLQQAGESPNDTHLSEILRKFFGSMLNSAQPFDFWRQICKTIIWSNHDDLTFSNLLPEQRIHDLDHWRAPVFAICAFGIYSLVQDWWEEGLPNPNEYDEANRTLLYYAATANSHAVVKKLLDLGADPNLNIWAPKSGGNAWTLEFEPLYATDDPEIADLLYFNGASSRYCDACEGPIVGNFKSCDKCAKDGGVYDLCTKCVGEGKTCPGKHSMEILKWTREDSRKMWEDVKKWRKEMSTESDESESD